jgi:hypothetical protein
VLVRAGPEGKSQEEIRMTPRILLTILFTALFVILSGCSTAPNCPTCGTTVNGSYAIINVIPVPEHNSAGEPGGPFNSFDISWIASPPAGGLSGTNNLDYVSDRVGLVVQVIDTAQDLAMFSIQGSNAVSGAGNGASPCPKDPASHSAYCGRIWQFHPLWMQNRHVYGYASGAHLPPHHWLRCQPQLRRIPGRTMLCFPRQRRESHVRARRP